VHLSEALFDVFVKHGVGRCFIAFDRDEAGDRGAEKVAAKLMPAGVACFRVQFPKGMDANEVALKMTPAKTLALACARRGMGNGGREASHPRAEEARARSGRARAP
jgi:DNA primase